MRESDSILEANNLSIGYEGKAVAENINFKLAKGDYLCIVGENGAGKSTLVKTLLGLQKPISGDILFDEKGIGYLPQQTVVQKDFPASCYEIVISGNLPHIGMRPFYGKKEKNITRENMERMGIWEMRQKCYRNLSGGQQQRVLLARALCASDKILFLDEPVSGLDPKVTAEFYELTKQLNKDGITIIMVSHDIDAVVNLASHVLHIGKGEMYFDEKAAYLNSNMAKRLGIISGGDSDNE